MNHIKAEHISMMQGYLLSHGYKAEVAEEIIYRLEKHHPDNEDIELYRQFLSKFGMVFGHHKKGHKEDIKRTFLYGQEKL